MLRPKKNSFKEFDKKNSCGSKIPHHHHNFSYDPSLRARLSAFEVSQLSSEVFGSNSRYVQVDESQYEPTS